MSGLQPWYMALESLHAILSNIHAFGRFVHRRHVGTLSCRLIHIPLRSIRWKKPESYTVVLKLKFVNFKLLVHRAVTFLLLRANTQVVNMLRSFGRVPIP